MTRIRGEGMSRRDTVDYIVEEMAWETPRRAQASKMIATDGIEYSGQETVDNFRDYLCHVFAYRPDNHIPHKWQSQKRFINYHWSVFIYRYYGIIQTWEEYKNTDAYRMARCQL